MQPTPRPYLAALRRDVLALPFDGRSVAAAKLRHAVDPIAARLIVREEATDELVGPLESAVRAAIGQAVDGLDEQLARSVQSRLPGEGAPGPVRHDQLLDAVDAAVEALADEDLRRRELLRAVSRAELAFRQGLERAASATLDELRRPTADSSTLTTEAIQSAVETLLPSWSGVRVSGVRRAGGLLSKEVLFVDVVVADETVPLVLRRNRPDDATRVDASDEFPVMRAMFERGLPVPEPLAATADPAVLGRPVLLMRKAKGETCHEDKIVDHSRLMQQAATFLATLHNTKVDGAGLPIPEPREDNAAFWRRRIEYQFAWWRETAVQPATVMHRVRDWLVERVEWVGDRLVVVHGDFVMRNLMADGGDLSAVLDWEYAHLGHPAEDFLMLEPLAASYEPWRQMGATYRAAGGSPITGEQAAFCKIWRTFQTATINAAMERMFRDGTSDDIMFGAMGLVDYPGFLDRLTDFIEQAERA